MNKLTTNSQAHRIHTDTAPIVSALKHGYKRIAQLRYLALCKKLNLVKWESSVVVNVIQNTCHNKNIKMV
jgi:hypothetical protein